MADTQHQRDLRGAARWCLDQRRGILTPSGKAKKPPTYWIVDCPDCGLGLSSSNEVTYAIVKKGAVTCKRRVENRVVFTRRNWTSSHPKSKVCGQPVTVIETIEGETT